MHTWYILVISRCCRKNDDGLDTLISQYHRCRRNPERHSLRHCKICCWLSSLTSGSPLSWLCKNFIYFCSLFYCSCRQTLFLVLLLGGTRNFTLVPSIHCALDGLVSLVLNSDNPFYWLINATEIAMKFMGLPFLKEARIYGVGSIIHVWMRRITSFYSGWLNFQKIAHIIPHPLTYMIVASPWY